VAYELFDRVWDVRVGQGGAGGAAPVGFDVSTLRCVFKVKKTLKPEPNTCELKIYNLAKSSRDKLSAKNLTVSVNAGYKKTGVSQLYLGEVRNAPSKVDGPDIITEISSGDGEKAQQKTWINRPVGPGTPALTVLENIAREFKGLGLGDTSNVAPLLAARGVATFHPTGGVLSGNAAQLLTDYCRSAGLTWSIQDGVIVFVDVQKPRGKMAVLLSAATGLHESPTVDAKGEVEAKCAILPGMRPGDLVVFSTESVQGGYRIEEIEYVGDTHGADWYASLKCKVY